MCSSIVREGCRKAELRGGCSMLAVETIESAWLLLSLAVRRSAHAAYRLPPRANCPVQERPLHHTLAVRLPVIPVRRTAKTNRTRTVSSGYHSRPSGSPELTAQAADNGVRQSLQPLPLDTSKSLGPPESSQIPGIHAVGCRDAVTTRGEPPASHSPFLDTANHAAAIADGIGRDPRSGYARWPAARLELLTLDEWNENETYDEDPPTCLHYSIEWNVTLNNKLFSKDTEPDLVLAPRFYWSLFLREKLDKLLHKKLSSSKRVTREDTNVVVMVTDRLERDLTKRFDGRDIDWFLVKKQFLAWGESFRAGRKLRVDVSFNYVEVGQQAPVSCLCSSTLVR
jgi:hypothetical protein